MIAKKQLYTDEKYKNYLKFFSFNDGAAFL
ncbi:hypothetical protein SAMN05421820_103286 [Pedobacter steynii]|uniref:Uncharacterized protein n=1 Tax=Pedobacter steynii TaxID=430522 RepID=A0A1G9RL68_9SPHI|nr:hypothetical protein SAMN05421820_103286 [Pedobacter steynii]